MQTVKENLQILVFSWQSPPRTFGQHKFLNHWYFYPIITPRIMSTFYYFRVDSIHLGIYAYLNIIFGAFFFETIPFFRHTSFSCFMQTGNTQTYEIVRIRTSMKVRKKKVKFYDKWKLEKSYISAYNFLGITALPSCRVAIFRYANIYKCMGESNVDRSCRNTA